MNHTVMAQIPFDPKSLREATNQGLPLLIKDPANPLSEGFLGLAQEIQAALEPQLAEEVKEEEATPPTPERRKRAGLFGRLKR
jgi:Flp pilus assembly CpaE family ATPase